MLVDLLLISPTAFPQGREFSDKPKAQTEICRYVEMFIDPCIKWKNGFVISEEGAVKIGEGNE